jgi:hypothetical protein
MLLVFVPTCAGLKAEGEEGKVESGEGKAESEELNKLEVSGGWRGRGLLAQLITATATTSRGVLCFACSVFP